MCRIAGSARCSVGAQQAMAATPGMISLVAEKRIWHREVRPRWPTAAIRVAEAKAGKGGDGVTSAVPANPAASAAVRAENCWPRPRLLPVLGFSETIIDINSDQSVNFHGGNGGSMAGTRRGQCRQRDRRRRRRRCRHMSGRPGRWASAARSTSSILCRHGDASQERLSVNGATTALLGEKRQRRYQQRPNPGGQGGDSGEPGRRRRRVPV